MGDASEDGDGYYHGMMPTATRPPLFTLGYQLRSIDGYVDELRSAGVDLVVDVREVPWSRKPGFSKSQLAAALQKVGIEYTHVKFAGNPKEIRKAATSHAACLADYDEHIRSDPDIVERFAELVSEWLEDGVRACLLCYERHPEDCHRSILLERATELLGEKVQVKHLGPEGAPRFLEE